MSEQTVYPGLYPGIIKAYDPAARQVRVSIPGITDGGDELPIAELKYPLGDKSKTTEIEILPGDTVWVQFIGGDQRYPIIDSYRNPQSGNSVEWRKWHHANIELTADGTLKLNAANIEINGSESVKVNGSTTIDGDTAIKGGSLTHESKNIGYDHTHNGVQTGSGNTGVPN
jgi:phage baseplate assembly protein gpV